MHRHFKKVIHPNRYLIWAVAIALIAGVALVSYIAVTNEQQNSEYVFPEIPSSQVFHDAEHSFTAFYPSHWTIERDSTGDSVLFENPASPAEGIVVTTYSPSQESAIRHSLSIQNERSFQKGNMDVSIMSATALKDKTVMQVALVKTPQHLFYIRGNSSAFTGFVNNFVAQ